MEEKYEQKDADYFVKLIVHDDFVIRTRATCILVDLGGEDKVQYVAKVLKNDPNELVRHEAAFSLGQMGYSSGREAPLGRWSDARGGAHVPPRPALVLVIGSKDAI